MNQWTYQKLLSIAIRHSYYSDGMGNDWQILPSAATANLLTQYKLAWRQAKGSNSQGWIYGEADTNGSLQALPLNTQLVFFMKLRNAQFMRITDAAQCPDREPLRLVNIPGEAVLQWATGNVAPEDAPLLAEAKRMGASLILDLRHAADNTLEGRNFVVQFSARKAAWTYFIIVRGHELGAKFTLVDNVGPSVFSEITASIRTEPSNWAREHHYLQALTEQVPNALISVFRSDSEIAWQEAARCGLEISKTFDGQTDTLIRHLPAALDGDFIVVSITKDNMFHDPSPQEVEALVS